jgi:hypothetical protein
LFAFSSNINQIGNENPQDTNLYIGKQNDNSGKFVNLYDYAITEDNKDYIKHKCKKDPSIIPDFATTDITTTRDEFWASGSSANYAPDTTVSTTDFKTNTELKDLKTLASFTTMYGGYNDVSAVAETTEYKITPPDINGGTTTNLKLKEGDSASVLRSYAYKYDCSKVYPEYLARLDAKEYIDNNETGPKNLHRCEWAKVCGVPWSSAGCS